MMGQRQKLQPKLFYTNPTSLEARIPNDHRLRRIAHVVDFGFVRKPVAKFYGTNGNPSIDPIVLMKMMLLLFLEDVKSERELMRQMTYRMDWMWFCEYDLDDTIPNHSVLSKARQLWDPEVFAELFHRILHQCIKADLVDGSTVHVDASCIHGNVDTDRLQPILREVGLSLYDRLDEDAKPSPRPSGRLTAQSDSDAGVTRSYGKTICGYKDHRVVDDANGIITATVTTDANRNEGLMLEEVLAEHANAIGRSAETVVADKQYGTAANYKKVRGKGITPCIPHSTRKSQSGKYGHDRFTYDPHKDCFICPAGQTLQMSRRDEAENRIRYKAAKGVCQTCRLRSQCTNSQSGRHVERNIDQDHMDWADGCLSKRERRRLMGRRKACVEGSFGDAASNHGFKRARWRGWWRMRIQNLLIAACQNLRKLLKATAGTTRLAMHSCGLSLSRYRTLASWRSKSFSNAF